MRIKYYVMAIAVLFIIAAVYILSSNKEDVNDYPMPTEAKGAYYFSFATGCYSAYIRECSRLEEGPAAECYERGLAYCEPMAQSFKEWIERGGK